MKTLDECQSVVARKYGLGSSLVTGHRKTYFDEAAEMYAATMCDTAERLKREHSIIIDKYSIETYHGFYNEKYLLPPGVDVFYTDSVIYNALKSGSKLIKVVKL